MAFEYNFLDKFNDLSDFRIINKVSYRDTLNIHNLKKVIIKFKKN